jgi:hypothetical protein
MRAPQCDGEAVDLDLGSRAVENRGEATAGTFAFIVIIEAESWRVVEQEMGSSELV